MRYIDTSVLMAFLLPESGSQLAERLMTSPGDALAFSSWTEVELRSALGIQIRRKLITRPRISAFDPSFWYRANSANRIEDTNG
jgi:predicted nucleic acid-binding protein